MLKLLCLGAFAAAALAQDLTSQDGNVIVNTDVNGGAFLFVNPPTPRPDDAETSKIDFSMQAVLRFSTLHPLPTPERPGPIFPSHKPA